MGASFSKSFSRLKGPKGTRTGVTGWGLGWASQANRSRNPAPAGPPDLVPDLDRAETETSTTPDPAADPESSERDDSITKKSA
jgi:hypothetical protein